VSELLSPVSGEVIAINGVVAARSEILNENANETWIIKVALTGRMTGDTLSAAEYEQFISEDSMA